MEPKKEKLIEMYRSMFTVRRVEERLNELFAQNRIPGFIHSYLGQEACAVGICSALRPDDYIISNHRGRGHIIAKGVELNPLMAEIFGKKTGICGGRGGEMHVADPSLGILGGSGIVGGGIPYSIGAGFSAVMRGTDQVTAVFFGEGATNEGGFHEALNLASVWDLPILFVCENNLYGEMTPIQDVVKDINIANRAKSYDIIGEIVDGNDVLAVFKKAEEAVGRARGGQGPTLLELKTYRWGGHFQGDPCKYRTREEEQEWKAKCPVKQLHKYLVRRRKVSSSKITAIEKRVDDDVEAAIRFAIDSPFPDPDDALKFVYAN